MEDFEIEKSNYKYVHGARVPNVKLTIPLELGDEYLIPDPAYPTLCIRVAYHGMPRDHHALKHNLCYPPTDAGVHAAIAHAQAMLGIHLDQLM